MRKYKGGALEGMRENMYATSVPFQLLEVLVYIFIFLLMIDIVFITPYNIVNYWGPGGCTTKAWLSLSIFTPISSQLQNDCPAKAADEIADGKCKNLGTRWSKYATDDILCGGAAEQIYQDALDTNVVAGYTASEILAYIIVPTLTGLGIMYGIIFSRNAFSEWIFWLLIATLLYTGLTTIASKTDIAIVPPTESSPLAYITDKLNFQGADELQYSFMARKADGTQCLVEGTMTGAGIHSSEGTPNYTGDCNEETLPLE